MQLRKSDILKRKAWTQMLSLALLCLLSISFVAEHGIFLDCEKLEIVENPESEKEKEAKKNKKVLITGLISLGSNDSKAELSNPKAAIAMMRNAALAEVQTPPPEFA